MITLLHSHRRTSTQLKHQTLICKEKLKASRADQNDCSCGLMSAQLFSKMQLQL